MGAGKRTRVVGVEEHQMTQVKHVPHPAGQSVLICEEATYEDQPVSHIETVLSTDSVIVPTSNELYEIIDLYSTEDTKNDGHHIQSC
jgi:hypothetical protein